MSETNFAAAAARLAHWASALLRWTPEQFWTATPAEVGLAIAPPGEAEDAPDRALVAALMARFPDRGN